MPNGLTRRMKQIKQYDRHFNVITKTQIVKTKFYIIGIFCVVLLSSCSLWNKAFGPKYGCGTNGKNVGAEKLIDGSYNKKQPKFKS